MKPKIVLPEAEDPRIIEAAKQLIAEDKVHPVLIGNEADIKEQLGSGDYTVFAPHGEQSPLQYGASLVADGTADGIVAGALHTTSEVLRAYFKIIGTDASVSRATSCFLMEKDEKRYIFADCGMNIDPTAEMLAESAYLSSTFARRVGIDPRIAFLSFSTKGSAAHESVSKVTDAVAIARERYPDLVLDGELQVDAALVPEVAAKKAPDSPLQGDATVLIFPDLNAGNIAYKIAERLGGFSATGPLILGLKKPAHDLSRGCSVKDIVSAVHIAALQCM